LRQRGLAALVIGALALAALLAFNGDLRRGVYLIGFSALIGAGAVVIGITALRKAKRTESFRPRGTVAGIVMGAFAMVLTIPMLAVYLAFPSQVQNYMSCMTQAQSTPTRQGCVNQFLNSVGGAKP
jgi:membrane protease YdiL (CAAX protease family)